MKDVRVRLQVAAHDADVGVRHLAGQRLGQLLGQRLARGQHGAGDACGVDVPLGARGGVDAVHGTFLQQACEEGVALDRRMLSLGEAAAAAAARGCR